MGRNLVFTARHELGVDGVKARVSERFLEMKRTYVDRFGEADLVWTDNIAQAWATALGQKGTAVLTAGETDLHIEIQLPWLLAPMAGMLQSIIESNADAIKSVAPPSEAGVVAA